MRIAVVTGPTRGIGRCIALGLASKGVHVIAAGRSPRRTDAVVSEIVAAGGSAEMLTLDLASLASAKEAAITLAASGRTIDILVNNAGIGPTRRGITRDGFESHFGVNHLGHFQFTHNLRPAFREGTRIVQVTSSLHDVEGIDFDGVRKRTTTRTGVKEYSVSKLANILFVRELARRHHEWRAYAVHPGFTDTAIVPWYVKPFVSHRLVTPEQGAETPIWCAISPDVAHESGLYYARLAEEQPRPVAGNQQLARELWQRSEIWCGLEPSQG